MNSRLNGNLILKMGNYEGFSEFMIMGVYGGLWYIQSIRKLHILANILYVGQHERFSRIKFLANRNFAEVFPIGQKIYLRESFMVSEIQSFGRHKGFFGI